MVIERHNNINQALIILDIILIFIAIFTPNFETSLFSIITLNIVIKLFYTPGIPLVILAALIFQWLQISIKVWYANFSGSKIEHVYSLYGGEHNLEQAFYLSSVGLIFLSLGIYTVIRNIDARSYYKNLTEQLTEYNPRKILLGYIIITFLIVFLFRFQWVIPGLNTIIVALGKLKWGFYLLFFLSAIQGRSSFKIFILITFIEIISSLSGYFSDFKTFVFFFLIGVISFTNVLSLKRIVMLTPLLIFVFQFGVIWTAVKGEYRAFLSSGTDRQVVLVSQEVALSKLQDLILSLDAETYDAAVNFLVDRVSFIEFFALTLDQVPNIVPYENGKIWINALTFYLKPRLFFPDKPVIDDSIHTAKYTGLLLAKGSQGASHSIGFMTDSYIDFGPYFMFIPIFFLGILIGKLYKYFLLHSKNLIWGLIFSTPFYLLTSFYSFNLIKVVGNFFIFVIVILLLRKYVVRFLDPFLRK